MWISPDGATTNQVDNVLCELISKLTLKKKNAIDSRDLSKSHDQLKKNTKFPFKIFENHTNYYFLLLFCSYNDESMRIYWIFYVFFEKTMKFLVKQLYGYMLIFQKIRFSEKLYIFIDVFVVFFETNNFDRKITYNYYIFF